MAVSNRELAMTLANEISSRLGRGRHKTHTPAELDDYVREEEARWRKIVTENNIRPE